MSNFTDQLATDATNVFCNADEFGESVTYYAAGSATGSSYTAVKVDYDDPGDPTPELKAARYHFRAVDVTSPKQGDRVVDSSNARWFVIRADADTAMARLDTRESTVAAYTTAEGTSVGNIDTVYRFFVGALDNRENALIIVSPDDVASPNEGDYLVISGESVRWYVNDVRERSDLFELRVIRTKDRS